MSNLPDDYWQRTRIEPWMVLSMLLVSALIAFAIAFAVLIVA